MQRHKTLKLTLIATLSIVPFGWANAACPDITGQWAATADEIFSGFTVAGVASIDITANTISYWSTESLQGDVGTSFSTGSYTVDQWCSVVWNFTIADSGGVTGVANGVIVNPDKMFLIFSVPNFLSSARVIAERVVNP